MTAALKLVPPFAAALLWAVSIGAQCPTIRVGWQGPDAVRLLLVGPLPPESLVRWYRSGDPEELATPPFGLFLGTSDGLLVDAPPPGTWYYRATFEDTISGTESEPGNYGFRLERTLRYRPGSRNLALVSIPLHTDLWDLDGDGADADDLLLFLSDGSHPLVLLSPENHLNTFLARKMVPEPPLGWRFTGYEFPLEPGRGYLLLVLPPVVPTAPGEWQVRLAGQHDPAFPGFGIRNVENSRSLHILSPPLHTTWETSEDLLFDLWDDPDDVIHVSDGLTEENQVFITQTIRADLTDQPLVYGPRFEIHPGEGVMLRMVQGDVLWDPPTRNDSGCGTISPDADGDGVVDYSDNCRGLFNPVQEDGDGDTRGDGCDPCPADDRDLCRDLDGDGKPDLEDNCPLVSNPGQGDVDGDEVGDACDRCPGVEDYAYDPDEDQDGYARPCDCAPYDDRIHPGAAENCTDSTDWDCDGEPNLRDEECMPVLWGVIKGRDGSFTFRWTDVDWEARYHLYRGDIGSWYSHEDQVACRIPADEVALRVERSEVSPDSAYFLLVPEAGNTRHYGLNSYGTPRPPNLNLCP